MTASFPGMIHDVIIPSGSNATRAIQGVYEYSDASNIGIQSPAVLDELTFTIEVSADAATWATLTNGASALPVPDASEALQYIEMLPFKYWRIRASGNVAADRTFLVSKQWTA